MQGLQIDLEIAFLAGAMVVILVEMICCIIYGVISTFQKRYRIVRIEEAAE